MLRFSLRTLLLGTALCGIVLALVRSYGPLNGILLALPHVAMIVGARMLLHRGRFRIAGVIVVLYLACWGATAVWGTRDVERRFAEFYGLGIEKAEQFRGQNGRIEFTAYLFQPPIGYDAEQDPLGCSIGPFFSPCPFIVVGSVGAMCESVCLGNEFYEVWFFGSIYYIQAKSLS